MCVDNKKTDFVLHNFHFYTANALIEVKISINDETKCFLSWFLNFVWTTVVNNYLTLCVNAIYDMFNSVIVGPNKKKNPIELCKNKISYVTNKDRTICRHVNIRWSLDHRSSITYPFWAFIIPSLSLSRRRSSRFRDGRLTGRVHVHVRSDDALITRLG